MAVAMDSETVISSFEQWYTDYSIDRDGCLEFRNIGPAASSLYSQWTLYKSEMDRRVANYEKYEKMVDAEVITTQPDLPNVSGGETAGFARRIARSLVQHTPNCDVVSKHDDDSPEGIMARYILTCKVIGDDHYSNDMQQNLFASTKTSFTLGFNCVIPVLMTKRGSWYMKYDTIHYRDVFPEPGAKDIRQANIVYVRRYLTEGDVRSLIRNPQPGWDTSALCRLLKNRPPAREAQSVDRQTAKHHVTPLGYEIITCYTNSGDPFLTFDGREKLLLRIEKNKHPLGEHPVFFLILEKDDQQPLGKSQAALVYGRQEFQDLMLNGAMKLWYRNINPAIIGYGAANAMPNLGPGKYTQIANPNARIEPFEVNTQTLLQYGSIAQQNQANMQTLVGATDQQMAAGPTGGQMSATPQGVEAQQQMVDITTNNYQKAIEYFFSEYCSYALTVYFQELKSVKKLELDADTRLKLLKAGFPEDKVGDDGIVEVDFSNMATQYWVRCVPGSLTEMEDEKQLRILNQLFVPLSQAMPALAATQNPQILNQAAMAMQYIIEQEIRLSGAAAAKDIADIWNGGDKRLIDARDQRIDAMEAAIGGMHSGHTAELELTSQAIAQISEQLSLLTQNQQLLHQKLGISNAASGEPQNNPEPPQLTAVPDDTNVVSASA